VHCLNADAGIGLNVDRSRLGADRTWSADQFNTDLLSHGLPVSVSVAGGPANRRTVQMTFIVRGPGVQGWAPGSSQDWHTLRTLSEAARAELSTHMHITA